MSEVDRNELVNHVKAWISVDDRIKALQKEMRVLRKAKKESAKTLMGTMKKHQIDCLDIQNEKLVYTKRTVKKPLSKKHLLTALTKYFKNDKKLVESLNNHIMETREEKVIENINRKTIKGMLPKPPSP